MTTAWKASSDQAASSVLEVPEAASSSTPTKRVIEQITDEPSLLGGAVRSKALAAPGSIATVYVRVIIASDRLVAERPEHLEADCSESTGLAALAAEQRVFISELGGGSDAGLYVDSPD